MNGYRIREELPQSAIELEKAQAVLRYVVREAVMNGTPWEVVDAIIHKVVAQYTDKLTDAELKQKAKKSLNQYATIQYRKLKTTLSPLKLGLFSAFLALATKSTTEATKLRAEAVIKARAPSVYQLAQRQYVEIAQPLRKYSVDYIKQVQDAWRELATSEAKDSYSERVSLRNIAEMTERWKAKQEEIEALRDNDLVWISTHANCSERCQPWQGKLYSISGRTGTIDGIQFQPLRNATDIFYTTKEGKTYRNGCISGFNCRHTLSVYAKGNKPIEVSDKVIAKYRAIEENQRAMERAIREKRALAIGLKDINRPQARFFASQSKELYEQYKAYCDKNKVAYYPARCKVFDGELLITPRYKALLEKYA